MHAIRALFAFLIFSSIAAAQTVVGAGTTIGAGTSIDSSGLPVAAAPNVSPTSGNVTQTVTVSCATGATPYYTEDGSTPTSADTEYTGPVTVSSPLTFKAVCIASGFANSAVVTGIFTDGTAISFSPSSGPFSGNVTVTGPAGDQCFETTDGSTANMASTEITGPVAVVTGETLNVICAQVVLVAQNTQNTSTGWKCVNKNGGTSNGIDCQSGGGTGSIQPSAWDMTWGATALWSLSTTSSTGETQQLFVFTGPSCNTCTGLTQDKIIEPTEGPSYIANNELDVTLNNTTNKRFHTLSLQCNQNGPNSGNWQYDDQQGSWQNFSPAITFGCPLSTTEATHVGWQGHWVLGDTGCGGYGCDHYDQLTITVGGTSHTYNPDVTLEAYTEPTWSAFVGNQDQIDLTNTATSGANPTTAGRNLQNNNITAWFYGTQVTASASY